MKFAFLLPTTEFGRDGIADYTARLAGEVEKSGHTTQLIPLGRNNWFTAGKILHENMRSAGRRIREFSPDVISWQFDGRIFHPLSIFPKWIIPNFSDLAGKIHFLAHETWEGDEADARLRRRLKGIAQKHSFQQALRVLAPDIAHTTNTVYLDHLQSSGLSAKMLPLFSSCPIASENPSRTDYEGNVWEFVLFGGFRDHWDPSEFVLKLKDLGRRIVIHHVGKHCSPEVLQSLRNTCRGWAELIEHGMQSDQRVSEILLNCHFAVSTYNLMLLEKSSVYATFVDHGLPVIVPRTDNARASTGLTPEIPEGVILLRDLPERLYKQQRLPIQDSLRSTTERFLKDLGC